MALTKKEREQLAALTEKAEAEKAEEDGYEIWVKKGEHEVRLTGAKARTFAKKFGIEDDEPDDDEEDQDDDDEETPDDDKPASTSFFKGRR